MTLGLLGLIIGGVGFPALAVPPYINYQGIIVDATTGEPISGQDVPMIFRIYNQETGGDLLWAESQSVDFQNGNYSVALGSGSTITGVFDAALFAWDNLWLEVVVAGERFEPRQRFTSVAAAFQAEEASYAEDTDTLDGQDSTAFAPSSHTHTGADITSGIVPNADLLDGQDSTSFAAASHTHPGSDISGIVPDADKVDGFHASAFAAASHSHDAAYVNTGEANSITSGMIVDGSLSSGDLGFNYAGSTSKGGAASNLACSSCVSKSELDFQVPGLPAQRIVVAKSGGDYTTISAALAAISPSSTNRYVVDVLPGTYVERVTMKSYVHLRGAGQEVAIIKAPSTGYDVIDINSLTEVAVSGLSIVDGYYGIDIRSSSSVRVFGNKLTGSGFGIYVYDSDPVIEHNEISTNRNDGLAISSCSGSNVPVIRGNTIKNNTDDGIYLSSSWPKILGNTIHNNGDAGIWNYGANAVISGNVITANNGDGIAETNYSYSTISGNVITGNNGYGFSNYSWSRPKVTQNRITGNGVSSKTDLYVDSATSSAYRPVVCFNMYDDITNNGLCIRAYNVTSLGSSAP
jgi:parallel beta-helix repeat protein